MAASPASTDRIWFRRRYGSSSVSGPAGVWRGGGTSAREQEKKVGKGGSPWAPAPPPHPFLTSIPGKVEAKDVGTVDTEIVQPTKVGLQLPTGQLCLQQQGQMAKNKGIQGGRAGETEEGGMEVDNRAEGQHGARGKNLLWWSKLWAAGVTRGRAGHLALDLVRGVFPQVAPAWP